MSVLGLIDIDSIVRHVLADLESIRQGASLVVTGPLPTSPKEKMQNPEPATLHITDRLLTLASLDGKLTGIRTILVPKQTVVTPAVKDFLRKQKVALEWSSESKNKECFRTNQKIWLALHLIPKEPATLVEYLAKQGDVARESFQCIVKTVHAAVDWARQNPDSKLVIVSSFAAAAVCLANRYMELRAIRAVGTSQVAADTKMVNANVLVIDPFGISPYQLQEYAKSYLQAPGQCSGLLWDAINTTHQVN